MDNLGSVLEFNSLCDKVYEYLRDQIMTGQLTPNTKLPENELASVLQVSRAPIREALNLLVNDGFVVRVPRHGAIVAPVTRKEIDENWELRILLEPFATRSACGLIPREDLLSVRDYINQTMSTNDFHMYMNSDYKIHSLIYQYVPNSQFQKILDNTMLSSMRYRFFTENNAPTSSEIILAVCHEHLSILEALLETDKEKAYERMLNHTSQSYARISRQLSELGEGNQIFSEKGS